MRAVEHFLAWSAPDADYVVIGEASIRHFLDEHLGCCDCPGRPQRGKVTVLSALRHLLAILRAAGRIPPVLPSFSNFIISELQDYCDYANDVCGLAPQTLISRRQWIGRFLAYLFPAGGVEFSRLGSKEIRDFFAAQCQGYQPGSAQVVASSVRSYLRFRALRHADPVAALTAAWEWSTSPKTLIWPDGWPSNSPRPHPRIRSFARDFCARRGRHRLSTIRISPVSTTMEKPPKGIPSS